MNEPNDLYEIRVKGQLSARLLKAFPGFTARLLPEGDTLLTGRIPDPAALYGLFSRLRDLGLVLVSANPARPGPVSGPLEPF